MGKAVEEFKDKVPQIGTSLKALIETERQNNEKFSTAFEGFCSLCRGSLNPIVSMEAVRERMEDCALAQDLPISKPHRAYAYNC